MQLVINTYGASLRKQGEQFLIRAGDKKFAFRPARDGVRDCLERLRGLGGTFDFLCRVMV